MSDSLDIVHFSTADTYGGAARCAYRIHSGVRSLGHRSRMLVSRKDSNDPDVDVIHGGEVGRLVNRLADDMLRRVGREYQFVPSTKRMLAHPWTQHPSVFQFFNLHGGYFNPDAIPILGWRAPIVWWLADMWPFTGHCVYSGSCTRWTTGCGECPDLKGYPALGRDRTAQLFDSKRRIYQQCDITLVAPSTWMMRMAQESPLFQKFPVHHIPNGIDLRVFKPIDRAKARAQLGLPSDAPVVLFAAHVLDANPRKGAPALVEAMNRAKLPPGTILALMGEGSGAWRTNIRGETRLLGNFTDDEQLAIAYSAADVFAAPSLADNLPSTVLESMACGVPAVAFDVGGMSDAVRHDETGYLAKSMDAADFARGLELLLGDDQRRAALGESARRTMEQEFALDRQSQRFVDVYREVIANRAARSRVPVRPSRASA